MRQSADIRETYTSSYYLTDCGGYEAFERTGGATLGDNRLLAMNHLAALAPRGRALDLGCGRGELSIALARQGFTVTAIDYSPDAVEIARAARQGAGVEGIELICDDLNETPFEGEYQLAVAADVVEHLAPPELDRLYAKVAAHLAPHGLFLVHTFPNAWHYLYDYPRRVRKALSSGGELPEDPRSQYEKVMHINEQSPRQLRRQLQAHFPHVLLWFAHHDGPHAGENLERRFRIAEMREAGDLFAVASHSPLDPAVIASALRMEELRNLGSGDLAIEALQAPAKAAPESVFQVRARVENRFVMALESKAPYPVYLSYHWLDPESGAAIIFDGLRTALDPGVAPHSNAEYALQVQAPQLPGRFRLRVTMVQEFVRWMDAPPVEAFADVLIEVK